MTLTLGEAGLGSLVLSDEAALGSLVIGEEEVSDPDVLKIEESFTRAAFIDTGGASGWVALATQLPAGAILLGARFQVTQGFTGNGPSTGALGTSLNAGMSPVSQPGTADPNNVEAPANMAVTGTYGTGAPSGRVHNPQATTLILTISGDTDFTLITQGAVTVTVYYSVVPA